MKSKTKKALGNQDRLEDIVYIYAVAAAAINGKTSHENALALIANRLGSIK